LQYGISRRYHQEFKDEFYCFTGHFIKAFLDFQPYLPLTSRRDVSDVSPKEITATQTAAW
jgi:hypothetical protein